jgi:glyoxalase family protein
MRTKISGLHLVTAISSDAQKNIDFYAGIPGHRMVKKTVSFDYKFMD